MKTIGKEQSVNLVKNFIKDILGGDINKLQNFSFLNLHTDIAYHQDEYRNKINPEHIEKYGGYFLKKNSKPTLHQYENDYDDMNLIRAINYLLYVCGKNKLPELRWEDLNWEYENCKPNYKEYNYRGETINTFNTLINEKCYKEYFKDIENSQSFVGKITKFRDNVFTMGNFMLLPNKKIGSKSLNLYKGNCLGDFSDLFLNHIVKSDNEYINSLMIKNEFCFKCGIQQYIELNYLQDYFNNTDVNYNFAPHYRHWYFDDAQDKDEKELYAKYIAKYIDNVERLISKRAVRMITDLKKIINEES